MAFIKLDHRDIAILINIMNEVELNELSPEELEVKKKLELIYQKQVNKYNKIKENHVVTS